MHHPPETYSKNIYNPYHAEVYCGKYCSLAYGLRVVIATHPSITHNSVSNYPFREKCKLRYPRCKTGGVINIGNDVWIGENVTLYGEINISDGAIIGGSSVVAKDVPPYAIVAGNPAKILRYRFNPDQIKRLLKLKWWDWPKEKIYTSIAEMLDINSFLDKYE